MQRKALEALQKWYKRKETERKPLTMRGARQIGKSYLIRDFCKQNALTCLEINFEKEPSLKKLFVEGHNKNTLHLLESHFRQPIHSNALLFLDEIQSAPEVFSRLRYFKEDTPNVPVIAAGSLLEFALEELELSVPVGRIEYLHLGPMTFEEFLKAVDESILLDFIHNYNPRDLLPVPEYVHEKLLNYVQVFSLIGGMPEVLETYVNKRDFLQCEVIQRSILQTYEQDFSKYRKRIPYERLQKILAAAPKEVGSKWVHARINPDERAQTSENALEALCKARVLHKVHHTSANGAPLRAELKDNKYKILYLDCGLMCSQLGLRASEYLTSKEFEFIHRGAMAEQWVGQHLLDHRPLDVNPELYYWVREKKGSQAEVDYVFVNMGSVYPVEVKAGSSSRCKSLEVFLGEKKQSKFGIHISTNQPFFNTGKKILSLPFYLLEQLPRILQFL